MTSDLKVTVFKPDSGELHDFGTLVVKTRPDPLADARKGLTHTKNRREWVNRKVTANSVRTLMVWKCFWCVGILIYPLDWQSRSISAAALSFWMRRANRDRTWGPWLTPPKINENETSRSAWENERRFCTPPLLHRWSVRHSTEKVLTWFRSESRSLSDFLLIRTVRTQRYHSKHAHRRRLPRVPADISQYIQLLRGWLAFTCPMRPAAGLAVSSTARNTRADSLSCRRGD